MLSVAVCTHNRPDSVAECFATLSEQARSAKIPIGLFDSGSEPNCAARLRSLAEQHGATYVRLDEVGLSVARNAAAEWATSDWIAYLDDDALPCDDWAKSLTAALTDLPRDIGMLGGMVVPKWPNGADCNGVSDRWRLLLSCVERQGRGSVSDGFDVCGANLAVRKSALVAAGGFPVGLGRVGSNLLSGEEAYLIELFRKIGIRSFYDSSFRVSHTIHETRLNRSWAKERSYWEGYSRVKLYQLLKEAVPSNMQLVKLLLTVIVLGLATIVSDDIDYVLRVARARGALMAQLRG